MAFLKGPDGGGLCQNILGLVCLGPKTVLFWKGFWDNSTNQHTIFCSLVSSRATKRASSFSDQVGLHSHFLGLLRVHLP